MIVREVLDNGLRLVTEAMPHVRSVSIGVWLTRGSRHESDARSGIAHFVEHMLFKGTDTRTAEDIAQAIDSIGGQLDAFTSKEYAGYYIKVLDEHLPLAVDLLADVVLHPLFADEDVEREKKVILEEIKMVEDTPDDLVHEIFTEHYWAGHPLGRPILGTPQTVESFTRDAALRVLPRRLHRAEPHRLGRGQPAARGAAAIWCAQAFGERRPIGQRGERQRPAHGAAGGRSARRTSSRATSASARPAITRRTTIATPATSSTRCSAAR